MAHVIVKRPRAYRFRRRVEDVGPPLTRKDFIAAPAVAAEHSKRPCTVRINPVFQRVQVKAVAVSLVGVQDMDVKPLAGTGVERCAGHAPVPRRLVDIGCDDFRRVGHRVIRVEIFSIHQSIEAGCENLVRRDSAQLVPLVEHAVAPIVPGTNDRCQRAVAVQWLDFQKNVTSFETVRGVRLSIGFVFRLR